MTAARRSGSGGSHRLEAAFGRGASPTRGTRCEKTHRQGPDPVPDAVEAGAIRGMSAKALKPVPFSRWRDYPIDGGWYERRPK